MNHDLCGLHGGHKGLGAGPTKKQREEDLAHDVAKRILAEERGQVMWEVVVTSGRKILQVKAPPRGTRAYQIVLNKRFVAAPEHIRQELANFGVAALRRNSRAAMAASARAAEWANTAPEALATSVRRQSGRTERSDGLDLNDLYERLVKTHIWGTPFERGANWDIVQLSWGRRSKSTRRIQLGLYSRANHAITLHGNMQDPGVPGYVIAFVMWHEMMHHWQDQTGRVLNHDAVFFQTESLASMKRMSDAWIQRNLDYIMGNTTRIVPIPESIIRGRT